MAGRSGQLSDEIVVVALVLLQAGLHSTGLHVPLVMMMRIIIMMLMMMVMPMKGGRAWLACRLRVASILVMTMIG